MSRKQTNQNDGHLRGSQQGDELKVRFRYSVPEMEIGGRRVSSAEFEIEVPLVSTIEDYNAAVDSSRTVTYQDANAGRLKLRKHNNRTLILGTDLIEFLTTLPLYLPTRNDEEGDA